MRLWIATNFDLRFITEWAGLQTGGMSRSRANVFLDLQSRQWRQADGWNMKRLGQYAEERQLLRLQERWTCHNVIMNKLSTLALAFSCDGQYMASSHLSHEIIIHKMQPHLHISCVLSGHSFTDRSPWCLTFHPSRPHFLLSGCLGGTVQLWDVQLGNCLCFWSTGILSPINNLVFLPSHPHYFLVAYNTRLCLMHYQNNEMKEIWRSETASTDIKVRLVLHHPECGRILTALTDKHVSQSHKYNFMRAFPQKSSYRLQMYSYSFKSGPDLENASSGLISLGVRILSPQSVVLTDRYVISSSTENATFSNKLSIHSIHRQTFGQCLHYITLTHDTIVSLDLSFCQRFLLVCVHGELFFHRTRSSALKVFQVNETTSKFGLELCCELMYDVYSAANVARWLPPECGVGGVCVGTQQGEVVWWGCGGGDSSRWRGRGMWKDITKHCSLKQHPIN